MTIYTVINLVLFSGLLSLLYQASKRESWSLSRRVLLGLLGGVGFGLLLEAFYASNPNV